MLTRVGVSYAWQHEQVTDLKQQAVALLKKKLNLYNEKSASVTHDEVQRHL